MTGDYVFRVVWPIDEDTFDEPVAITTASLEWPGIAEGYQVTAVEVPRIRVEELSAAERVKFRSARGVVCEVAAIKRIRERTTS